MFKHKLSVLSITVGLFVCFSFASFDIAYPTLIQSQFSSDNFTGVEDDNSEVGYDIHVQYRILVTHLGIVDSDGDGIQGSNTITANLWDATSTALLGSLSFSKASQGFSQQGFLFKELSTPLVLDQGFIATISAGGFNFYDPYGYAEYQDVDWAQDDGLFHGNGVPLVAYGYGRWGSHGSYPSVQETPFESYLWFGCAAILFKQIEDFQALNVPNTVLGNYIDGYPPHGFKFQVNRPITVSHLGSFDHDLDGFYGNITVDLWDLDNLALLASVSFSPSTPGDLFPSSSTRYLELPQPLYLPCAFNGFLSAVGYSVLDPFPLYYNKSYVNWIQDEGDNTIDFQDSFIRSEGVTWGAYNDPTSAYFAAGSMIYQQVLGRLVVTQSNFQLTPKKTSNLGDVIPTCICADKLGRIYVGNYEYMWIYNQDWVVLHVILQGEFGAMSCHVDDDLNLFVTATYTNQVYMFDPSWTLKVVFGSGSTTDLYYPRGVVSTRQKKVFISERWNYRISEWDYQGNKIANYGGVFSDTQFAPLGNFDQTNDITSNVAGDLILVGDIYNQRVQAFHVDTQTWTRYDNVPAFGSVWGVHYDGPTGLVFVGEYDDVRLSMLNQCGERVAYTEVFADKVTTVGNTVLVEDYYQNIYEYTFDCKSGFYGFNCLKQCSYCNPEGGKCNDGLFGDGKCTCFAGYSGDICDVQYGRLDNFQVIEYNNPNDPFKDGSVWRAFALDIDWQGNIYVAAYSSVSGFYVGIQVFSPNHTYLYTIGKNELFGVKSLKIDHITNTMYVAEYDNSRVTYWDLNTGGSNIEGNVLYYDSWNGPASIAIDQSRRMLYITNGIFPDAEILFYDLVYENFTKGVVANNCSECSAPVAVAIDQVTGVLYYVDQIHLFIYNETTNDFIPINSNDISNENYVNCWGGGLLVVYPPGQTDIDLGRIWSTDGLANRINQFSMNGTLVTRWGGTDIIEGTQLAVFSPKELAVTSSGLIVIADSGDRRVVTLNPEWTCVPGHYGPTCVQCSCLLSNSQCNDGKDGDGSCSCIFPFTGPTCAICSQGYELNDDGSCALCPPSTFGTDGVSCLSCAPGSYSSGFGAVNCTLCAPGSANNVTGATNCDLCLPGFYTPDTGSKACTAASPGKYTAQRGSVSQSSCPPNTFSNQYNSSTCTPCDTGTTSNIGAISCNDCPEGFYGQQSIQGCIAAPAGTFVNSTGALNFTQCFPGTYTLSSGQEFCQNCSIGSFSNGLGSTTCTPCSVGYYSEIAGQSACKKCPPGTYSDKSGSSICNICDSKSYNPLYGASSCLVCPAYARPSSNSTTCQCIDGYYPSLTSNVLNCIVCPTGGDCDGGILQTGAGWWRINSDSDQFYKCLNDESCLGNGCAVGYQGVLCAVCQVGYIQTKSGGTCQACPPHSSQIYGIFVGLILAILMGLILLFTKSRWMNIVKNRFLVPSNVVSNINQSSEAFSQQLKADYHESGVPKFKIMVGFVQILGLNHLIYDANFPSFYTKYTSAMTFLNLDITKLSRVDCILKPHAVNFYTNLLLVTLIPLGIIVLLAIATVMLLKFVSGIIGIRRIIQRAGLSFVENLIVFLFVIYTGVTSVIFRTFQCDSFDDGSSWLKADYSVQCYTPIYKSYVGYAMFMIFIYPIGLPLIVISSLFYYRTKLAEPRISNSIGSLYNDYKWEKFPITYYEAWDTIRKLLLTGFVVFIKDTTWALFFSTIISSFAFAVQQFYKPYRCEWDNRLNTCSLAALAFTYLVALVALQKTTDEVSSLVSLMIATHVFVYLFGAFVMVRYLVDLGRKFRNNQTRAVRLDVMMIPPEQSDNENDNDS